MSVTGWLSVRMLAAERACNACTIWRQTRDGLLPPPVKLGTNTTRWPRHEIATIDAARLAGANDAAVRELVLSLVAARIAGDASKAAT